MDFSSWNDVKGFYKHFMMKEPISCVYFIMDRHDDNRLIGFIERTEEGHYKFKECIGYLHFTPHVIPQLTMFPILGFHFFPCKKVLAEELKEINGFDNDEEEEE